ncbi:hypothetical protein [Corynebacterium sp. HMSC058E07]|uniref:hypothetical protein n=1 Tax=Corynebacterium TaxID=1716 RepID=UPI000A978D4E
MGRVKDPATGRNVGVIRAVRSLDPFGSLLLGLAVLAFLFPFVESSGNARTFLPLPHRRRPSGRVAGLGAAR